MLPRKFKCVNRYPISSKKADGFEVKRKGKDGDFLIPVVIPWYCLYTYDYHFEITVTPTLRSIPIYPHMLGTFGTHSYVIHSSDVYEPGTPPSEVLIPSAPNGKHIPRHVAYICMLPVSRASVSAECNYNISISRPYIK